MCIRDRALAERTGADVLITEVGGTIGDIESQPFIEAIRQIGREAGRDNAAYIHVTLVPYLRASGEHKTKPTQHSDVYKRQAFCRAWMTLFISSKLRPVLRG